PQHDRSEKNHPHHAQPAHIQKHSERKGQGTKHKKTDHDSASEGPVRECHSTAPHERGKMQPAVPVTVAEQMPRYPDRPGIRNGLGAPFVEIKPRGEAWRPAPEPSAWSSAPSARRPGHRSTAGAGSW